MLELDRREARLLFHKNGCHTAIRFLCSFVIAISVRNQGRELQRNTELAFTSSGDDLVASEFRFKASEQGWFISTWSIVVYTNNFSLTRYLPVFITRVDDQQAFLYNFPLTRFLSLSKFSWTSFGCVRSALQLAECCEKFSPSLMPSQGKGLLEVGKRVGERHFCL